ncbi:MAG: hypothetical protein PWQ82_996 [Thermosediminibacterales bacterium]|nr:hypothetical protein [Thermosediminibacterales bacterium]
MDKTVIGVFDSRDKAENAVNEMRNSGFTENEISIVAKNQEGQNRQENDDIDMETGSVADGTTTGSVLGGLAGLAVGAGALAIPGLGPIIAAGPIAGLLSGAASGGIAGALIDWGIPEERGREYEEELRQGKILATVRADESKIQDAANIFRKNGAKDVETHS